MCKLYILCVCAPVYYNPQLCSTIRKSVCKSTALKSPLASYTFTLFPLSFILKVTLARSFAFLRLQTKQFSADQNSVLRRFSTVKVFYSM